MVEFVDAKLVGELARIFEFPYDRIIWGSLFTGRLYWGSYVSSHKGVAMLPYMTMYRVPHFHTSTVKVEEAEVQDVDDTVKKVKLLPVLLSYTVELLQSKVTDQTKAFKNYMMWAGVQSAVFFTDADNVPYNFRVIPEDPEDNSDLEAEEDTGRIIRSTFNFQVETVMLISDSLAQTPIQEILTRIQGYYDEDSVLLTDFTVTA